MRGIEVRWGVEEDEAVVGDLLELNGMSRRAAFEERFIVAERGGKVLAAVRADAAPGKMSLGAFVADLRVGEREFAVAVYCGARRLAKELGIGEIRADALRYGGYPREAGYRRWIGGWRLDVAKAPEPREGGICDPLSSLTRPSVPFLKRLGI